MMRFISIVSGAVALAVGLVVATPRPVAAATDSHPFKLRLGAAFPLGGVEDNPVFTVGGEFDLPRSANLLKGAQLSVSVDWQELKSRYIGFDHTFSVVPLLFNARWSSMTQGRQLYYGLGIGATFASVDAITHYEDTNFGWQAFLGTNFNPKVSGDLRFVASTHPGDDGMFLLEIGFRP
jgi:hypothetical protein